MTPAPALDLVLMWHMHQPDYRDAVDGRFLLPWVYLHATKDYADMAAHIERHRGIRAVFNFVPVLLEQLEDYARQFDEGRVLDELLDLLRVEDMDRLGARERALIVDSSFRQNHVKMLQPYPQYRRLHALFKVVDDGEGPGCEYLSGAYLSDLLAWYHLVWIGETERRTNPLFRRLMEKGSGFTHADRIELFDAIGAILKGLLDRYRALAADGRIELSTTPRTHPIGPLLLDFGAAREAMPDVKLPHADAYPGGTERVRWHLRTAVEDHVRRFGVRPSGLWPSEGGVSRRFVAEAGDAGFEWIATSESVLANSLGAAASAPRGEWLYRPWSIAEAPHAQLLFRDERLSDLIGFEYSNWHGRDAAAHLIGELEAIARAAPAGQTPVVLIALDGENAWDFYPYNGYYFFEEFYGALERHPFIRTRTAAEVVGQWQGRTQPLARLVAGSWVLGTFSTWIGDPDKNRAWDLLCEAKRVYDEAVASGDFDARQRDDLVRQLAVCEGSDWFWWLGPYNPASAVERFERLFRHNLVRLYEMLGRVPPAVLDAPLGSGGGHPEAGGTMRRATRQ